MPRATLVCFEAPHRMVDALADMLAILGDRRIVVARDLTKPHEEFRRERISQALAHFQAHTGRAASLRWLSRGAAGRREPQSAGRPQYPLAPRRCPTKQLPSEAAVAARLRALRDQGKSGSAAARQVARELGLNKSLIYQIWIWLDTEHRRLKIEDRRWRMALLSSIFYPPSSY